MNRLNQENMLNTFRYGGKSYVMAVIKEQILCISHVIKPIIMQITVSLSTVFYVTDM
jgi:hypothetical protein